MPAEFPESSMVKARATLNCVHRELQRNPAAALPRVIQLIKELSGKIDAVTVDHLAELIGQDMVTATRIMEIARTMGYNPEGVEITSIIQAIHIIGFNKIRNLAISLLISRNVSDRKIPPETQEISLISLVAAFVGQATMSRIDAMIDDEAFICSALRSYGDLVLSLFLPEDYRLAAGGGRRRFEEVFGLVPARLGHQLLRRAKLPELLVNGLKEATSQKVGAVVYDRADLLLVVSHFANRLCALLNETSLTQRGYAEGMEALLGEFRENIGLGRGGVEEVLEETAQKLGAFRHVLGEMPCRSPLLRHLEMLRGGEEIRPAPAVSGSARGAGEEVVDSGGGSVSFHRVFAEGVARIDALKQAVPLDPKRILQSAAQTIKAGLDLDHCLVLAADPGTSSFVAVTGTPGRLLAAVENRRLVDPAVKSIFSICLTREEDVVARDPGEERIRKFIPDWIHELAGRHPFLLLPVRKEGRTAVIFCGFVVPPRHLSVGTARIQETKKLRRHLLDVVD